MQRCQTNERFADSVQLKLAAPAEKVKINTKNKNYFVSLNNTKNYNL
jgi:hypothetical protein